MTKKGDCDKMNEEQKHCPKCGRFLTDKGLCYRCDSLFGTIIPGQGEPSPWTEPEIFDKPKRRTAHVSEIRQKDGSYVFPTDMRIKFFDNEFKFALPIIVAGVITIFKPEELKEQVRVSKTFGGKFGGWCKKGGNAQLKISGTLKKKQPHWYENIDGTIAGVKIV